MTKTNKILRVGFDLDGVILYNPIRIVRPIIALIKKVLLHKKKLRFYTPQSNLEKIIFRLLHRTSIFVVPGLEDIKQLVKKRKIKAYIVSARFGFLQEDFENWLEKINAKQYFDGCYFNKNDEQPHIFKEKTIAKLSLDVFVEDNWDIVNYLKVPHFAASDAASRGEQNLKTKIFWIYNLLDRNIDYSNKFPYLKKAVDEIKNSVDQPKKKVLIATDYFYPHWTGISKALNYLTQHLKNDFDFTVLTVRYKNSLRKSENLGGVKIIRENYLFDISRAYYSLSIILRFIKEVNNCDVVLINSPFSNMLIFSIICKLNGKKLLIFHQGDLILTKGIFNRVIEKMFDLSARISCQLADKVSTYTQDYAENSRILKPFLHKFTALIPPINVIARSVATRQSHFTFGFAGRFVEEKGFDILFDAIPKVIKQLPNAQFVFAGETNITYENFYEKNLSKLKNIKDYIKFLGLLDDKRLGEFYKQIDFIILPSRSDCFPLVQAEAMLAQTPAIATNIPGARYLVKESGFGLLFKKENPNDLAQTIIEASNKRGSFNKNYTKVIKILNPLQNGEKFKQFIGE